MERQPLLIDGQDTKALLVMLRTNVHDHVVYRVRLDELKALVESLGIEVVGEVVQTRYRPFSKYYVGKGKVEDIRRKVQRLKANVVIFYNIINSSQKLNLIQAVHCEVIDRFELTLEIFDQMASDTLSKLQIQAARLEKQAPFYKLQASVNYQYDRPFFRAGGEYGFHAKMRELTRSQAKINEEIDKLMEDKNQRIWQRKKLGYPVICIAGYYNAGKTHLFNRVTGDSKPVSDRPFTTLSSKYQKRYIDWETTVLFIDTIGFVLDLDPRLIESFKLNLLDIRSSDLVILLLDVSDPVLNLDMKLNEGIWLLRDIGVSRDRIIVVINKSDLDPEKAATIGEKLELDSYLLPWIVVSAEDKTNVPELLDLISKRIKHIRDNPPEPVLLSPFRRAETTVNRILAEYPVQYEKRYHNPFNSLVGTILSQNTSGSNRESAFNNLEKAVGINPYQIDEAPESKIKDAIRSAGMYNQRTKVLKQISRIIIEKHDGNLQPLFDLPFNEARDRLMELPGVGPKTADVALMFVADRKVIPVDRHIERISKRLEIVPQKANYETIRSALQDAATPDRFLEVHLSLIKFGKETCTARHPKHEECLMNDICPFYDKLQMKQKRLEKEKARAIE
jgi:GTP-binding protein HflX